MRALTKAIATVLLAAVVALGALSLIANSPLADTPVGQWVAGLTSGVGNAGANALLDASGVKGKVDAALRGSAGAIASATGLSESQVNAAIDQLAIESWEVATLPADATASGSFSTTYNGTAATVTTYDDPGYATVTVGGRDVTLAVPQSAQGYLGYLAYL